MKIQIAGVIANWEIALWPRDMFILVYAEVVPSCEMQIIFCLFLLLSLSYSQFEGCSQISLSPNHGSTEHIRLSYRGVLAFLLAFK